MSHVSQMLNSHPRTLSVDASVLAPTIETLDDCAQTCTACADDDLGEPHVHELVKCIRLCLDCADVCNVTSRVITRQTEVDARIVKPLLEACAATCKCCGEECQRHAEMHEHCRICAESCRRCEQSCRDLLTAMG